MIDYKKYIGYVNDIIRQLALHSNVHIDNLNELNIPNFDIFVLLSPIHDDIYKIGDDCNVYVMAKDVKKIKKILINALFAKYKIYCENTCSFYERNFFETLYYVNNLSEKYLSLTKYVVLKKIMDALNIKDGGQYIHMFNYIFQDSTFYEIYEHFNAGKPYQYSHYKGAHRKISI